MKCAYCRGEHATTAELEACSHRRIAWDALEYQRDKERDAAVRAALNEPPASEVYGDEDFLFI